MIFRARSLPRGLAPTTLALLTMSSFLLGGCLERELKALNPCLVSGVVATVAVTNIDKVDMLFMVDNSDSMGEEQTKLRTQFPRLITVMTTGMRDNDPTHNFPPAKDLHLGVVTSDMGLPGVEGIANCGGAGNPLGQDGILQHSPSAAVQGCQASYPPFLSYNASTGSTSMGTATDFQCIAVVGTGGCGFEHQLEAPLKALWPSVDPMAAMNGGKNRIQFLADPATGKGALGHGDVENAGFLRNDPVMGLSLIAIILLTDEDDCSSADTRPFTPPMYLDPNDPLVMEGMNVRCHYNQPALYPLDRYVLGFKALRPGNENLVIYAAITGVPADLVDAAALAKVGDFSVEANREGFYKNILADGRMQEVVQTMGTPDVSDDKLQHSCNGANGGTADPPIRVVEVAHKFGENGIVQSICQEDYGPSLDAIIAIIAKQLGAVCLPRSLVRNSAGLVNCQVVWELPPPGAAPAATPTDCGGANPFLIAPPSDEAQVTDKQGRICRVTQLAVVTDKNTGKQAAVPTPVGNQTYDQGWFYDDFSDEVTKSCTGNGGKQRISFTANAKPPTGVTVKLQCLNERQSLSDSRTDLAPATEQPTVGSACEKVILRGQTVMGDDACIVQLKAATKVHPDAKDHSMFCHPKLNVCVLGCNTDAECPAAWVCDNKRMTTLTGTIRPGHANGTPICINPTCGDVK